LSRQEIKNKVVIITGASSGIGEALAWAFAKRGAKLSLAARGIDNLNILAQKIRAEHHVEVISTKTDVAIESDCRKLISETIRHFEQVHILINNAGISMRALFADLDLKVLRQVMDVNFWGTVYCTKYALPHIESAKGSIAGISSIAGYRGLPWRTGYCSSKFALQGFLESLRTECIEKDVNVLWICPGFTTSNIRQAALMADGSKQGESPRNEQKMMTSEEVAERTVKAIENRKRSLVLTSQGKLTVFLNKWIPGLMDRLTLNHLRKEEDQLG